MADAVYPAYSKLSATVDALGKALDDIPGSPAVGAWSPELAADMDRALALAEQALEILTRTSR